MRKITLFLILVLTLSSLSALAQDLIGQPRVPISNPASRISWPYAAVNGQGEIGAFYMWFGGSSSPDGIAFRKLDQEGKPIGPQKFAHKTNPSETRGFSIHDVVWADGHYFVCVSNYVQNSILLFKFSESGTFVSKTRYKLGEREALYSFRLNCIIFGDDIYIPLTTGEGFFFFGPVADGIPKGDRKTENYFLKANISDPRKFEKVDFHKPTNEILIMAGASSDADHIVFLLCELWLGDDLEYLNPRIVKFNPVTGEVGKPVMLDTHKEIGGDFFLYNDRPSRPVYNGNGHLFFYTYFGIDFGYYSFVYDSDGNTVRGPVDLGQLGIDHGSYDADLVGSVAFMGNHHYTLDAVSAMLLGPKGKHMKNIFYEENRRNSFQVGSLGQVFTGNHVVFCYVGLNGYLVGPTSQGIYVYTKATPTPKPIKDGISFFQAGAESFADGSRHVVWSTVGSESVTLKHNGKEYNNLPPLYSYQLKDVNLNKPVELTFTSAAGKTYSKRLNFK